MLREEGGCVVILDCITRCGRKRGKNQYMCYECWHLLPLRSRKALKVVDDRAMPRFQELLKQVRLGVPLEEIVVNR